jgi:hypothetical protein
MSTGQRKGKEENAKHAEPGCHPGDFGKMFGEMGLCCGPERFPDCLSMMKRMADAGTHQPCCEPAAEKNE